MKIYNKLVLDMRNMSVLEEDSFEYAGPVALAAGGMLTKQADYLTAKYLNDVNDATAGGAVVSVPAGATGPQASQLQPGDRIVLDDLTALALSDTAIGTLYGGVYMYTQFKTTTRAAVRGGIAFNKTADIGVAYIAYGDADPSTTVPTHIAGILINVITANSYGWIQVAGAASVLFDSTALTAIADGDLVTAKVSATTASTADVGAAPTTVTVAALLGVAYGAPVSATVSLVMLTRGLFCGRI